VTLLQQLHMVRHYDALTQDMGMQFTHTIHD
jgi:hypothetical protein